MIPHMESVYVFLAAVVFAAVVSVDLFACALGFGSSGFRVPWRKVLLVNIIGKVMIGAGLICGYFFGAVVPQSVSAWIGFIVVAAIGVIKIIQSRSPRPVSSNLSWGAVAALGMVTSLDGTATAFAAAAGMSAVFIPTVIVLMSVTDQIVFALGNNLGFLIARQDRKCNVNLEFFAGLALVIFAVVKLWLD
jgi:putative Mn2+ efflux pump MntP